MHEVLVNRLGGLSLPRKSVVRLTDRPDMTLDVYRGHKTTIQPTNVLSVCSSELCIGPSYLHCILSFWSEKGQQGFWLYRLFWGQSVLHVLMNILLVPGPCLDLVTLEHQK